MKYRIDGAFMQVVNIELNEGECVYAEAGAMTWMSDNMEMESELVGGIGAAIGRKFGSRESAFLINFKPSRGKGFVAFANDVPGKIIAFQLKTGESLICQKDAFLCSERSVKLSTFFRKKFGPGWFGGQGFILEKIEGPGTVWIALNGEIQEIRLEQGQKLKIDTSAVGLMEPAVRYDIQLVKGIKNMLFGGEGFFLATVEGPGKVWLQSANVSGLAGVMKRFLGK
ncbi:Mitochondrial biogenesis AIM24 [Candidatus Gugararchaeum adminiculabundum]|nr:Mitochondrial biogenesis AIM24 [Candidatus Gugararchaeum adminiculabundum]